MFFVVQTYQVHIVGTRLNRLLEQMTLLESTRTKKINISGNQNIIKLIFFLSGIQCLIYFSRFLRNDIVNFDKMNFSIWYPCILVVICNWGWSESRPSVFPMPSVSVLGEGSSPISDAVSIVGDVTSLTQDSVPDFSVSNASKDGIDIANR